MEMETEMGIPPSSRLGDAPASGNPWKCKKITGNRENMGNYGEICENMRKYEEIWGIMGKYGEIWENMGKYGEIMENSVFKELISSGNTFSNVPEGAGGGGGGGGKWKWKSRPRAAWGTPPRVSGNPWKCKKTNALYRDSLP